MRLFFKSEEARNDLADMNRSAPSQAEQVPAEDETALTPCPSPEYGRGEHSP
jgi:hypothetical protein